VQKSAKIIAKNKKAKFSYEIIEKIDAGIVLRGSEVKAIRDNKEQFYGYYFIDTKDNHLWCRIGTCYIDDYYPSFTCWYNPKPK